MTDQTRPQQASKGCVHIYTGEGKGKTTAAAGLAARALGRGLRVCFIQFLKNGVSGEVLSLNRLGAETLCPQSGGFVWQMDEDEKAACAQKQADTLARAARLAESCDLLVLDEVICAVDTGMLPAADLMAFVRHKPPQLELVLTGRGAGPQLLALADYATEMQALAHPYSSSGLPARKGVEF